MATVAATVSTVAACSSSQKAAGAAASGGANQQASGSSGGDANADLVIWADQKKADSLKEIAKSWGQEQGITVAVQIVANDLQPAFITANQAGNGPDIVMGAHDWIGNLVQNSAIRPVVLSPEAEANYSDIALKAVTYDGQIYATPYAVECLGLFVNKALTQVTEPATIEEMVEAGTAAGTELILSQAVDEKGDAYNMEPIYTAAGGYLFGKNPDGSYNSKDLGIGKEGSIRAAEKIGQLGKQGVLRKSVTAANHISLFTDAKAPYLISGPWALADIKKAGIDYQLTRIPGFGDIEGSQARPFAGVNCFYVASNGKNKAFAETFVADAAKDMTFAASMFPSNELPPAQKDLAEKLRAEQPDMVTFADMSAQADPMPAIPAMSSVWEPFGRAQANIVAGADPASTMAGVGETIRASIDG
ncbi:ABC transporter, solute-binding protein [Actinomyces johnsonii F0542]|uniref:ABC transporter, solute-binding protein n=2 Tax=Actinomycetaceae TaxID=2049 RepID=U1QRG3_9ACTO|nr:ABC transporter, solute-binding protein [Actinomyces johnsonii F0542]